MVEDKLIEIILKKLKGIDKEIIYIFGSYAKKENTENSDVDIAFYSKGEYDSFEIFLLAQEISIGIKKEVDLVQLKKSSTVFQKEVVENGICIYEKNSLEREKFELLVYKKYFKLNEERKEIIDNYEV
ncbi:MAG: nucleotidyltransferase domain-containing protein [Psychrilyobacter sp.]|uniref:type VII toxin-antitoxin system MntA family adenylyltransferase antitoxin n=1 Tax=Psychrilyobacter sp. TaxID=2586924 RepID=UPI003C795FA6